MCRYRLCNSRIIIIRSRRSVSRIRGRINSNSSIHIRNVTNSGRVRRARMRSRINISCGSSSGCGVRRCRNRIHIICKRIGNGRGCRRRIRCNSRNRIIHMTMIIANANRRCRRNKRSRRRAIIVVSVVVVRAVILYRYSSSSALPPP